mmetsp:Transcript_6327/g.18804  ORF Transcript_6327/g.18804 Transcript_6327/m.18804 type:complete len:208 (-) Transcript_6327:1620-2243(-)
MLTSGTFSSRPGTAQSSTFAPAARHSASMPSLSVNGFAAAFELAPMSSLTNSRWQLSPCARSQRRQQTLCKGAWPACVRTWHGSRPPVSRSMRAKSWCPLAAAQCRGVRLRPSAKAATTPRRCSSAAIAAPSAPSERGKSASTCSRFLPSSSRPHTSLFCAGLILLRSVRTRRNLPRLRESWMALCRGKSWSRSRYARPSHSFLMAS